MVHDVGHRTLLPLFYVHGAPHIIMDSSADARRWAHLYAISLWWPHRSWSAATTARLYRRDSWRSRTSHRHAVSGLAARGGSGVVLELLQLASSIKWTGSSMSTSRWDLQRRCVRPGPLVSGGLALIRSFVRSGVPPPVSRVLSQNPHLRLFAIAWQVGVWLQRLSHESILCA